MKSKWKASSWGCPAEASQTTRKSKKGEKVATAEGTRLSPPRRVALGWAFVERQTNLWKRYWAWEVVWLVYGTVNTLAITFIAKEVRQTGAVDATQMHRLVLFLLI